MLAEFLPAAKCTIVVEYACRPTAVDYITVTNIFLLHNCIDVELQINVLLRHNRYGSTL